MEAYVALAGMENHERFWKTTPREIFALADIKMGHARHQQKRAIMADYVEGDS